MKKDRKGKKSRREMKGVCPPDDVYLDYDPMPNELKLRASYRDQAPLFSSGAKKVDDELDTGNAGIKLIDDIAAVEGANSIKND